ncbi:hypothetical protein T265_13301, partial [Opisthorchis viverrini]
MRLRGVARSVEWEHHKPEIQLGPSALTSLDNKQHGPADASTPVPTNRQDSLAGRSCWSSQPPSGKYAVIMKVSFLKTTSECPKSTEPLSSTRCWPDRQHPSICSASQPCIKPRYRESALIKVRQRPRNMQHVTASYRSQTVCVAFSAIWVQLGHKADGNSGCAHLVDHNKGETGRGLLKSFQQPCEQVNVLHQAASCFIRNDIRDIAIHVDIRNALLIRLPGDITNERFRWVP